MVIKPKTTFNEPGIEFILTYYDNPGDKVYSGVALISNKNYVCLVVGIKIPKYVTNWVAQRQLPDFIEKLYHATKLHAERKTVMKWGTDPGFELDIRLDEFEHGDEYVEDIVNKKKRLHLKNSSDVKDREENEESEKKEESQPSKSWWSYLLFYNYLH